MDFIHRCINNNPQLRPHAGEIVRQVSHIASQFPATFANQLEILRQIEAVEEEKRALTKEGARKSRSLEERDATILAMSEELARVREYIMTTKQQVNTDTPYGTSNPIIIVHAYVTHNLISYAGIESDVHVVFGVGHILV